MQFFFLMLATIFHKTRDFEKKICKKIQKLHYFFEWDQKQTTTKADLFFFTQKVCNGKL